MKLRRNSIIRRVALAALLTVSTGFYMSCQDADYLAEFQPTGETTEGAEPFQWTRAEDVETRSAFLRNFGVGYSYDAVRGEYCNWEDIRCQVINRARLDYAYKMYGTSKLWSSSYAASYYNRTKFEYSHRDYIAASTISTKEEIDLGLYAGTKRKKQEVLEDGVGENFYYCMTEEIKLGVQSLDVLSICATAKYYLEDVLTSSFIDAVNHLAMQPVDNFASVDSFTNVWGTHVIVEAALGGKLEVDLQNRMHRYTDQAREEEYTSEDIAFFYSKREENRKNTEDYKFLTDAKLCVSAVGGDLSSLNTLLGEYKYDGTRTFSLDGIKTWTESLHFDREDDEKSNVEMVEMKVVPIWTFIEVLSPEVAELVKAHVTNDAKAMNALLGERNFFSAKFPVKYSTANFQYRKGSSDWKSLTRTDSEDSPMVVNIVSGGRYIATVCHENYNGHWFWVAYPIYEGRVKLACGLGIRDDDTYWEMRWKKDTLYTSQLFYDINEKPAGDYFYINGGLLSLKPSENVEYAESFAMPYYELSGGIRPDGSYDSQAYPVVKKDAKFHCYAPHNLSIPLITWEKKTENGKQFWLRQPEYTYIYNPNETKK